MIQNNELVRQYYFNLFTANAEKTKNGNNNHTFKWNIRDLQLSKNAEIGLSQIAVTRERLTEQRQFPPKAYNTVSLETSTTLLNKSVFTQTITLNTTGITYGSGDYIIYSSSRWTEAPGTTPSLVKSLLFDYTDEIYGAHWEQTNYTPNGVYNDNNFINPDYLGDWIIVKLPVPIILNKYYFRDRAGTNYRAPGEWKVYGSNDGVNFIEITEASQMTRLISTDYVDRIYTKMFSNTVSYQYIGFTINKLIGTATGDLLNFSEIRLFGKQIIPEEKQYPPKLYNSSVNEITTTGELSGISPTTFYKGEMVLNTDGIDYGSGRYTVYSSSTWTDFVNFAQKIGLFNYDTVTNGPHWSVAGNYDGTTGIFKFTNSYIVNGYYGDWVIIKLPSPIILSKFIFWAATGIIPRAPSLWKCYGSNDGINFTEIKEASNDNPSNALTNTNYPSLKYEKKLFTFNTPYLYIGFTFNKTIQDTLLNFAEIQLFGREEIKTLTEERQYPSKSYDSFTNEITSSGEILNINPTNYIKETITLNPTGIKYGIGDYIIYSSSTTNIVERRKALLFNKNIETISNDLGANWQFGVYTQSSGLYYLNNYIKNDYLGDWVIIKLPSPIILSKFIFYIRASYMEGAPSLWRCYGSNDGSIWEEIEEASNNGTALTYLSYNLNSYEGFCNNNKKSYSYIGFTFKKVIGVAGGTSNSTLWINELQLFGKEELNNTYIIRGLDTYQDGFDSQNRTAAILYIGDDFKTIKNPTYHKLISRNLNSISLNMTDTLDSGYNGINDEIDLGMIFHIKDYGEQETMNNNI